MQTGLHVESFNHSLLLCLNEILSKHVLFALNDKFCKESVAMNIISFC